MSKRKATDFIVIHCTATKPSQDIGVTEVDAWHRARTPPFRMIGYHSLIRLNGTLELGREFNQQGAHVKGYNSRSVSVAMVGGLDDAGHPMNTFNNRQFRTLELVVRMLAHMYPGAEVLGHRDLSPDTDGDGKVERHEWLKECPCFDAPYWWKGVTHV